MNKLEKIKQLSKSIKTDLQKLERIITSITKQDDYFEEKINLIRIAYNTKDKTVDICRQTENIKFRTRLVKVSEHSVSSLEQPLQN